VRPHRDVALPARDAGLDLVLDQIEALKQKHPRTADQRVILEHYGFAREDQRL
jgi:hypothetical protein